MDEEDASTGFYKMLKTRYLKHIYTCLYWVKPKNKELHKSVIVEIFKYDLAQLTEEERKQVPSDYIKQLCFIALDTPGAESSITP